MSETVLVTGGFGLAGRDTVKQLAADGRHVVATTHRTTCPLPDGVETRRVDLADTDAVQQLVTKVSPDAIVHLAAVIPPLTYRDLVGARRVNVDSTIALVKAAASQPDPPRFLHASSCAIFGPRNPHRVSAPLNLDSCPQPYEHYGAHKLEAEIAVRAANMPWTVLRLGSIVSVDPAAQPFTADTMYFGASLPIDSRLHTVDTRDVATAIATALGTDVAGEVLFIGGDDSHLLDQGSLYRAISTARGIPDIPLGRHGNPDSDTDWYPVGDWMDVDRAQDLLRFQRHSWPAMLDEVRFNLGWKRHPARLTAPLIRSILKRRSPYRGASGTYADVWTALRSRFGEARIAPGTPHPSAPDRAVKEPPGAGHP